MLNLNPYLGQRIADRREQLNLSQDELAKRIGVREQYIVQLEKGKESPDTRKLARIAAALGVSLDELNRHARYLWNL